MSNQASPILAYSTPIQATNSSKNLNQGSDFLLRDQNSVAALQWAQQYSLSLEKFKEVQGASDWFSIKRAEKETLTKQSSSSSIQKKTNAYFPLNHLWKPPRVNQERYQVNAENIPVTEYHDDKPLKGNKLIGIKRKRRSYSLDQETENDTAIQPTITNKLLASHSLVSATIEIQTEPAKLVFEQEKFKDSEEYEKSMQDYLEVADFIMTEANSSCNGIWLKGSSVYQEKALALLHSYNYNFNLAKFHILYPSVMAIPSQKEEVMRSFAADEKEMESIVNEALIDLRGCKSQEALNTIEDIRLAMKNRITLEELGYFMQILKKMRIDVPADIEKEISGSKEFSKTIKKKCGQYGGITAQIMANGQQAQQVQNEKKLKIAEIQSLQDEAAGYLIITSEMQQLQDYVKKANQWIDKANQIRDQVVNVKILQNIVQESRGIPVNFENLIEEIKKRYNDAQTLVERIHSTFTKVNKTRTQIASVKDTDQKKNKESSTLQSAAQKLKKAQTGGHSLPHHTSQHSATELQYRTFLAQADELKIQTQEVQKLRSHLEEVDQWQRRVYMLLEDEQEQSDEKYKEIFQGLLRETHLFKFDMELTKVLAKRFEYIEWKHKVRKIWLKLTGFTDRSRGNSQNAIQDNDGAEKISLKSVQQLMREGEQKGFSELAIEEVQYVGNICIRGNKFEEDICKALKDINEGRGDPFEMDYLVQLLDEGMSIQVTVPEIDELQSIVNKVKNYESKCTEYLQTHSLLQQNINLKQQNENQEHLLQETLSIGYLKEVLKLRSEIKDLGVTNHVFKEFSKEVKPIIRWLYHTRALIKAYQKTLDVQLSQQQNLLLEVQNYNSSSDEEDEEEEKVSMEVPMEIDQQNNVLEAESITNKLSPKMKRQTKEMKGDIPRIGSGKDYDLLIYLLKESEEIQKMLMITKEYQLLKEIQQKVNLWLQTTDEILAPQYKQEQDDPMIGNLLEKLEKLANEYLPLPLDKVQKVSKQLRREKWLKKLMEITQAEKVKLKQIESLVKDSMHPDIQEDGKCKEEAFKIKEDLILCKEWINLQATADLNLQSEIEKLIDAGKSLKLNLIEYVDLKMFYQDVLEWKIKTKDILNSWKDPDCSYEFLRKHIQLGIDLEVEDSKDLDILKGIVDMCAHWKSIARKVLKIRPMVKLEYKKQNALTEANDADQNINEDDDGFSLILAKKSIASHNPEMIDQSYTYRLEKVLIPQYAQQMSQEIFDSRQYCICRRGDDGYVFMIACDSCQEWFHGDCIGISKALGIKVQSYMCIACARRKENFNPLFPNSNNQHNQSQEEESKSSDVGGKNGGAGLYKFDLTLYQVFCQERRPAYDMFRQIIDEGSEEIPIQLEEMQDLVKIRQRVEVWLEKVQAQFQYGVDVDGLEEIIQTASNQPRNQSVGNKLNQSLQSQAQSSAVRSGSVTQQTCGLNHALIRNKKKQLERDQELQTLYLESESFPTELAEADDLVLLLRQRDWCRRALKVIKNQQQSQQLQQSMNQQPQKQSKIQLKKTVKNLLTQSEELKLDTDKQLQQIVFELQALINQTQMIQGQTQIQQQQYSTPYGSQNTFRGDNSSPQGQQQIMRQQNSQDIGSQLTQQGMPLSEQIDYLLENGADYGDFISLIEKAQKSGNFGVNPEEFQKLEDLKALLGNFSKWLSTVREYLNNERKSLPIEFENLMVEGQNHYWMINSVEKNQYQVILQSFYDWSDQCDTILREFEQLEEHDIQQRQIFMHNIQQLLDTYKQQIPIYSELSHVLEDKLQCLVDIENRSQLQIEMMNEHYQDDTDENQFLKGKSGGQNMSDEALTYKKDHDDMADE